MEKKEFTVYAIYDKKTVIIDNEECTFPAKISTSEKMPAEFLKGITKFDNIQLLFNSQTKFFDIDNNEIPLEEIRKHIFSGCKIKAIYETKEYLNKKDEKRISYYLKGCKVSYTPVQIAPEDFDF